LENLHDKIDINRGTEVLGGYSKTSVKVVTRLLGGKAVYTIVGMKNAQNYQIKVADKTAMVAEPKTHEWR
jgi:hypothetical protein